MEGDGDGDGSAVIWRVKIVVAFCLKTREIIHGDGEISSSSRHFRSFALLIFTATIYSV